MSVSSIGFLELFFAKCRTDPDAVFVTYADQTLRFRDLDRQSRAFAEAMRKRGLQPGDRVATMMRNIPEAFSIIFGLARAGFIWVPINPEQRGVGLQYLIEHCDPRAILLDEDRLDNLRNCGADIDGIDILLHEHHTSPLLALLAGDVGLRVSDSPDPQRTFAIMYTSGTTGNPKGVLVTHAMMRYSGEAAIILADAHDGDRLFMWEPLYHIGGAQLMVMPLLRNVTIAMTDRFRTSRFWKDVASTGSTHIHYLGGILEMLLSCPSSSAERSHGARIGWGAGARPASWQKAKERFGIQLHEAYGMTETSSIATFNKDGLPGNVGRPVPWFQVAILDESGVAVPPATRGEIVLTPLEPGAAFVGYYKNVEASRKTLRDGKLFTSDVGSFDLEGRLRFHGRLTDSVRYRGENISALEIEQVANQHPAIADCAVLGVPAEIGEQDIKLVVQRHKTHVLEAAELSDWLSEQLTPYQRPRFITFVETFERTPSQRIMKHKLSKKIDDSWDRLDVAAAADQHLPSGRRQN